MVDFDAIAIGGGLAGSAFALELARQGVKVAIIERTRARHQKVCGDFHSREAQAIFASLGLDLSRLGATRITTFRLATGHRAAEAPLPFTAAGLSRQTADEAMLDAARAAGAEVLRGASATGLEPHGDRVSVRIGSRTLSARAVALATGKHNLRGWPRTHGALTAFKIGLEPSQAARAHMAGVVQLVGYRGGYAGACTVEAGTVPVCWLADGVMMRETEGDWRRQLAVISAQCPRFGDLVSGARFLAEAPVATAAIPFGYMRRGVIAGNVYPVGDQLAVIPSFTGDGTSLALATGLRAARAVLAGQTTGAYQRAQLERVRVQFAWARAIHLTLRTGPTRALALASVATLPPLASAMAALTRIRDIDDLLISRDPTLAHRTPSPATPA